MNSQFKRDSAKSKYPLPEELIFLHLCAFQDDGTSADTIPSTVNHNNFITASSYPWLSFTLFLLFNLVLLVSLALREIDEERLLVLLLPPPLVEAVS